MKNNYSLIIFLLLSQFITSQIVINELDTDTPSTDTLEFIELKSDTPNFSLDGYVVVLFNSSTSITTGLNKSYFTLDLDGYTTDVNGLLLIGSNSVSPTPQLLISPAVIQNGPDAVAIYLGSWDDFPDRTLAYVDDTLIDVLLYETNDATDVDLIDLFSAFNSSIQIIDENENGNMLSESIQRNNDGTYFVGTPTPRQLNDGSGIVLNGVSIAIAQTQYNEDEAFDIVFTAEQNITDTPLNFDIVLNYNTFDTSDFTGNTSLIIPVGQKTTSTTITLVDDANDEGDEVLKVILSGLVTPFISLNNNLEIRIVDNDFTMAAWGEPTDPTFGVVSSTQPNGYYDSLDGKADAVLRQALQDIIADPGTVRAQTYTDVIDILKEADQNPAHSNQVWLVYTEQGRPKLDFQTTSNSTGKWNREHTYPRSRGGFGSIDLDDIADGPDVFWATKADSLRHGNSDAHALRAADGPENSSRNNQNYGSVEYDGPTSNSGSFYGDVARSVLYMAVRYNGLAVINGYPGIDPIGQLGDLATLLDWHRNDPPDDYEMNRNNVIYNWQFNRNPFIDQPDLVEYLWGTQVGNSWSQSLSVNDTNMLDVQLYPNPTHNRIYISGLNDKAELEVFSVEGKRLLKKTIDNSFYDFNLTSGMYFIKIVSEGKIVTKKVVIR